MSRARPLCGRHVWPMSDGQDCWSARGAQDGVAEERGRDWALGSPGLLPGAL